MLFSSWLRRARRTAPICRPEVEALEDRLVPAPYRPFFPPPPPATHFLVSAPRDVVQGQTFAVTVQALDAKNRLVTGFQGNVRLTLGKADPAASLPTTFFFSALDRGKHTVQMTLTATNTQTVKATCGLLAGQTALSVNGAVTHFGVRANGPAFAGYLTTVYVVALDASNNVVPGYAGTVRFSSSDFFTNLPLDYTFAPADRGNRSFNVAFGSVGVQTISVTDASNGTIAGIADVQVSFYYSATMPWYSPTYTYWNGTVSYPWW